MSVKQLRFASVLLAAIVSIAAEAQGNITGRVIDVTSRWDRYLGITAPMTQVPVPTGYDSNFAARNEVIIVR